jgi:hypothetical protein
MKVGEQLHLTALSNGQLQVTAPFHSENYSSVVTGYEARSNLGPVWSREETMSELLKNTDGDREWTGKKNIQR